MQRQQPFLSPTGLTATVIVLLVIGVFYWRTGGQMFNPGPLAFAHTDITDCAACHQPLRTNQGALCLDCHTELRENLSKNTGLHARLTNTESCMVCHADHKGLEADLRASALEKFDHELTQFSLDKHQFDYDSKKLECRSCHNSDDYSNSEFTCLSCHDSAAPVFMTEHTADFGLDCIACHDGVDSMNNFNHAETGFLLEGKHLNAACADCHEQGQFAGTATDCAVCHAEPIIHKGLFQHSCEDCHNPSAWRPAMLNGQLFDHFSGTGFSLGLHKIDFDGSILECTSCHTENLERVSEAVCEQCHTAADPIFMTNHITDFGQNCQDCHDGQGAMQNFDHSRIFPLDGAHIELECSACHIDFNFEDTDGECAACHTEPPLHAGLFGLNCASCHSTAAWQPAALSQHSFPLDHGGEGIIACATCHPAAFVQYTCDRCHEPAEMLEEHNDEDIFNIIGRCLECHPTGQEEERED